MESVEGALEVFPRANIDVHAKKKKKEVPVDQLFVASPDFEACYYSIIDNCTGKLDTEPEDDPAWMVSVLRFSNLFKL